MPKTTKLFLSVTILLGLAYLIAISGLVHVSAQTTWMITVLLGISGLYALPLSFVIARLVKKPLGVWWKVLVVGLVLVLLGSGLGWASSYVPEWLPTGGWTRHEQPPEPLAELVTSLPINVLSGGVYARTAAGSLYLHSCAWGTCGWTKADALPAPSDKGDYWSGTCYGVSQEPNRFVLKPPPPGKVIDTYATRYCGPDYRMDTYFVLLEDSSLWSWGTFWSVYTFMLQIVWAFVGGLLAMIWGAAKK